jgi:hypothetical protein
VKKVKMDQQVYPVILELLEKRATKEQLAKPENLAKRVKGSVTRSNFCHQQV